MSIFVRRDDRWTEVSSPPQQGLAIWVRADDRSASPEVQAQVDGATRFAMTGATPRPDTDTTHTVAQIDPESGDGASIFAVHAADNDIVFEELEVTSEVIGADDLDHVRSALNEILIPVYIDDVVSDLSERVPGLIVVHTVQYKNGGPGCSYFRSSAFSDGNHAFEAEYGSL